MSPARVDTDVLKVSLWSDCAEVRMFRHFCDYVLNDKHEVRRDYVDGMESKEPFWPFISLATQSVLDACYTSGQQDG